MSSLEIDPLCAHKGPLAEASPAPNALPVELLQEMFPYSLNTREHKSASLRSLSLLNKTFRMLAQSILFSHVALSDGRGRKPSSGFLSLIRDAPHIAPFVVSLEVFVMTSYGDHCDLLEILPSIAHIQPLKLVAALNRADFQWLRYPGGANESLRVDTFPKLRSLSLFNRGCIPLGGFCRRAMVLNISRYRTRDTFRRMTLP